MLSFITNFLAKFFSTSQPTVVVQQPVEVLKPEVKPEAKPKKRYYKPKVAAISTPVKAKPANTNVASTPAKVARIKGSKPK